MLLGVSAQLTGCVASTAVKSLPLATKGNRFNIIEPGDGLCSKHRKNYGGNAKETRDVLREPESSYLLFLTNFKGFVPSLGQSFRGVWNSFTERSSPKFGKAAQIFASFGISRRVLEKRVDRFLSPERVGEKILVPVRTNYRIRFPRLRVSGEVEEGILGKSPEWISNFGIMIGSWGWVFCFGVAYAWRGELSERSFCRAFGLRGGTDPLSSRWVRFWDCTINNQSRTDTELGGPTV